MTGMIDDDTGLINQDAGLINDDTGLITENSTEYPASGRRKRSRERGKDSKPRNFPLHTMKNLPQFRDKPHEDVRQYILQTKGVDIGSNFNWNNPIIWFLIGLVVLAGGIAVSEWWQQRQKKNEMKDTSTQSKQDMLKILKNNR